METRENPQTAREITQNGEGNHMTCVLRHLRGDSDLQFAIQIPASPASLFSNGSSTTSSGTFPAVAVDYSTKSFNPSTIFLPLCPPAPTNRSKYSRARVTASSSFSTRCPVPVAETSLPPPYKQRRTLESALLSIRLAPSND
jgi:hypothetical protein